MDDEWTARWSLRYWVWQSATAENRQVPLPGLRIDCIGKTALVSHGVDGIEIGGAPDAANWAFWTPWAGYPSVAEPSEALLDAVALRPSNVAVTSEGDLLHVGAGPQQRSYAMRDPVRRDGRRWSVQARHDGELFVLTVHPAHLPCYSGVTWLALAATGEPVACGANSAATAYVAPEPPTTDLVLPEHVGTYLSCPAPMNLSHFYVDDDTS